MLKFNNMISMAIIFLLSIFIGCSSNSNDDGKDNGNGNGNSDRAFPEDTITVLLNTGGGGFIESGPPVDVDDPTNGEGDGGSGTDEADAAEAGEGVGAAG